MGELLSRQGRTEEAIEYRRKAIALQPDLADPHVHLAEALIGLGRFDEAVATWEKAFSVRPNWPEVHGRIQNAFYFSGQIGIARRIYQARVDVKDDFARMHELDKLGFRFLRDFPTAIGHIGFLGNYVKMELLAQRSTARAIPLVSPVVSNPSYLNYWRRYFPVMIADPVALDLLSPVAEYLDHHIGVMVSSSGKAIVDYDNSMIASIQAQWEAEGHGALLTLTDSDDERGWQCLHRLGVPSDAWFVSLHVREGRDSLRGVRDADVRTYQMAIESIVARGGWVIRMGDPSMTPLTPMPQVIDYVHSQVRSDWMDVFLWARCRFFIATSSGPAWVPPTFGVPSVVTNWNAFFARPIFGGDLFIPKLFWYEVEGRHLSFAEALTSSVGSAESLEYLASKQIRVVDNTPEEISDVVVEMLDKPDGKFNYSEEDEQLHERFNKMWGAHTYPANGRIGTAFLRKWAHLL